MLKMFKGTMTAPWTLTDKGISFKDNLYSFSQITDVKFSKPLGRLGNGVIEVDIAGKSMPLVLAYAYKEKESAQIAFNFILERINEKRKEVEKEAKKEIRMKCNVCGQIFCYNSADIQRNRDLMKSANIAALSGGLEALFGTRIAANQQTNNADNLKKQIVDYSRCPKCNSTDVREISEGEQIPAAETPTTSAMDELKKLKELLDMGIVTQEEFDAKKKQLLGL